MKKLNGLLMQIPSIIWVLAGFLIIYILFFIFPTFLNGERDMYFPRYIPSIKEIGLDLRQYLNFSHARLVKNIYIGNYPPFPLLFFYPLTLMRFTDAYIVFTLINLISMAIVTFIIPGLIKKTKTDYSLLIIIFITGLFSYGFQFELERGQFNIIALAFCFSSIYLFHYKKKYRILSYILFSISIQLKLWPGIFILLFIEDWEDWKNNIKRFSILLIANFFCLFMLGYQTFIGFFKAISAPPYFWLGNHSIAAFINFMKESYGWGETFANLIQVLLFIFVGLCLTVIIIKSYKDKRQGLNEFLLFACTISACVIPSISHDYKLSILPAAMIIALSRIVPDNPTKRSFQNSLFLFSFSLVYSITLFSYVYKPPFLASSLPVLILLLAMITGLFLSRSQNSTHLDYIAP